MWACWKVFIAGHEFKVVLTEASFSDLTVVFIQEILFQLNLNDRASFPFLHEK